VSAAARNAVQFIPPLGRELVPLVNGEAPGRGLAEHQHNPLSLDLGLYQASFARVPSGLSFSGVNIKAKATSVTPTTIYP
jgi:hypothetical protein